MKNFSISLFVIFLLISQATFSQDNWISLNGSGPQFPVVQVESQDMSGMTLTISVPGIYLDGKSSLSIDFNHLSEGLYFLVIEGQGEKLIQKLIVRK